MLRNQRNSKKQGDVGLGIAIGWFAGKGYTVCVPLTDSQPYDLVVDNGDGLKRVQVKTVWNKRGRSYQTELRTRGGNRTGQGQSKDFDPNEVEFLFVYCDNGKKYLIPTNEITANSILAIHENRTKHFVGG
jgi:hypothetical protein